MAKGKIIKASSFKPVPWSGGKTTELFVYPTNSDLKNHNFEFRLSLASIEEEESFFTPLPGVFRTLILLDGELQLTHDGDEMHTVELFDHNFFQGDSKTKSIHKATVFNVMSSKKLSFIPTAMAIQKNSAISFRNLEDFEFVYMYKGEAKSSFGTLKTGDLLVVNEKMLHQIEMTQNSVIVQFSIDIKKGG